MRPGKVVAIKRSIKKGAPKEILSQGRFIESFGLEGDLHAGAGGRQVSLMGCETIDLIYQSKVQGFCTNKFVENITTEAVDLWTLPIGAVLSIGETIMEITEVGKECFRGCPLREIEGSCAILQQVVFAKVLKGGFVRENDSIIVTQTAAIRELNK